ncbi:MAG: SDR family oxidoreductase [Reyranella sp.]|nr:SDR family oxidoreductase [Reyranella sp.]
MQKKAVVVGALGVIGRYIVERLVAEGDWQVVGLSRRPEKDGPRYRHVSVDLLDLDDVAEKLADLRDVTHVFYAAFQAGTGNAAGYASVIAPNRNMLVNSVTAIAKASRKLQRVVLVTGTKYYGTHLGPLKTPMRESDPRHMPPDFYFDQIDWLTGFQRGKRWSWTELRPQTLCGFAPGTAMSIMPAIAVYAAISKELGLPLRFPGKPGAYGTVYQVTESSHFASAALWAATEKRAANQAYNITNGDYFRWRNVWPRIARVFDMQVGELQTISLTQQMADKADLWAEMTKKHRLKKFDFGQLVAWPFADYVFGSDWDVMSDVTKSRLHGFHEVVDSEAMFERLLTRFRKERIVP